MNSKRSTSFPSHKICNICQPISFQSGWYKKTQTFAIYGAVDIAMYISNVVARNIIDETDLIHLKLYCWCLHLLHNSLKLLKTGKFYIRVWHWIRWGRWESIMCLSRKWHWSWGRIRMCMYTCMPVCIYTGMFGSMCVGNSIRNGITILLRAFSNILFCKICDIGFGLCITWAH